MTGLSGVWASSLTSPSSPVQLSLIPHLQATMISIQTSDVTMSHPVFRICSSVSDCVCVCIFACMHEQIYVYSYLVCMHVAMHVCIYTSVYMCLCICACIHKCACMHVYMCACTVVIEIHNILNNSTAGVVTHSLDYRKSAGGFIHGFRYTGRYQAGRFMYIYTYMNICDTYVYDIVMYCLTVQHLCLYNACMLL